MSQASPVKTDDPAYRQFCAEPSPDVFTVMAASGSGGGSLGLGPNKSVNAALQAAFSSSETGATIARTQTLNMLREMMFRTCERYLSGAVSAAEMPIVAARDQRIMVSILAIEQLTGSVTPRAALLTSGGSASNGMDPTELIKALGAARATVLTLDEDVTAKAKKQIEVDAPEGICTTTRKKKADGTPAMTAEDTNKLKACDDADAAYTTAKATRDAAQTHYESLLAASKSAVGTSTASTSGKAAFAEEASRPEAVKAVADVVDKIVERTFHQDETQLFCIRTLYGASGAFPDGDIKRECQIYLLTKVRAEQSSLAREYGLSDQQFEAASTSGRRARERRETVTPRLNVCAVDPAGEKAMQSALALDNALAPYAQPLIDAAKRGNRAVYDYLTGLSADAEDRILAALSTSCGLGS
ncbi:hypothetical protein [Sphingomonas aerolata]|uniref:hypothetical protein n=1 Tax=Sphingomonas aerolata TaxID=185951 RepID=UPI00208E1F75|nr:hypothetical protein [Sphingomonas aerolata]USR00047.1 hypothetical protein NEF64_16905 [Sphingomonas aerolata]